MTPISMRAWNFSDEPAGQRRHRHASQHGKCHAGQHGECHASEHGERRPLSTNRQPFIVAYGYRTDV